MTSLPQPVAVVNTSLQSPGMLGKAVKIRHCPATVSATAGIRVVSAMFEPAGSEPS
jgi:hypothetical protein